MRRLLMCCAASWIAAVPMAVQAAEIITFSPIAGVSNHGVASPYVEKGLRFAMTGGFFAFGTGAAANADPGGATLSPSAYGNLVITSAGGTSFDLARFDVADLMNNGSGGPIVYTYETLNGSGTNYFNLDTTPGLQTVSINLTNLTRLTIINDSPGFQLDNVVFTLGTTAVPEPASWALLVGGMGLIGGALRRRAGRPATA